MKKSTITIDVEMDENRFPENIEWFATDSTIQNAQKAKAIILALWNGEDREALRIDLWTQKMMVDEMADFYYQTFMGMADAFMRATQQQELVDDMKAHAKTFYKKFRDSQINQNK